MANLQKDPLGSAKNNSTARQKLNRGTNSGTAKTESSGTSPSLFKADCYRRARMILYFAAPILFFSTVSWMCKTGSIKAIVSEGGFVEIFQAALIAASALLLAWYAATFIQHRAVLSVAAALGGLALLREQNNSPWYDRVFFFDGASTVFGMGILGALGLFFRKRIVREFLQMWLWPSFLLLAFGALVVVGWAQTLAQKELFLQHLDDRTVEECLESAGYLLIFLGVLELRNDLKNALT